MECSPHFYLSFRVHFKYHFFWGGAEGHQKNYLSNNI
jgi:hypothetical protein